MSHLIIEQGKGLGTEISVPEAGMKFGRSPANDIVLEDDAVMLFHGRFFFKSDGTLWVTDFGAGEKTKVGGIPMDEQQLSAGDLVSVGHVAFRVINTCISGNEAAAPIAPPVVEEAPIDLGFNKRSRKHAEKPASAATKIKEEKTGGSLTHRLSLIATALLTLVVVCLVGYTFMKIKGGGGKTAEKQLLLFSYERVKADDNNISRYRLELDAAGNLSLNMTDLKSNRSYDQKVKIPPEAVAQLASRIRSANFFALSGDKEGHENGYDLYDLAIQQNGTVNHVKELNQRTPRPEVRDTAQALEDLAASHLDLPITWNMSKAELMQRAKKAFKNGEEYYKKRNIRLSNLPEAITNFEETVKYLEEFEPMPQLYLDAKDALGVACEEQDRLYEDYMFNADHAMQLERWAEAKKNLDALMGLVSRNDDRYSTVESKMFTVNQNLNRRR